MQSEYLDFQVYWASNPAEIRSAYSRGTRLDALCGAGMPELAIYFHDLSEQGWRRLTWVVSEDGMHEVYVFSRPLQKTAAVGGMAADSAGG